MDCVIHKVYSKLRRRQSRFIEAVSSIYFQEKTANKTHTKLSKTNTSTSQRKWLLAALRCFSSANCRCLSACKGLILSWPVCKKKKKSWRRDKGRPQNPKNLWFSGIFVSQSLLTQTPKRQFGCSYVLMLVTQKGLQ